MERKKWREDNYSYWLRGKWGGDKLWFTPLQLGGDKMSEKELKMALEEWFDYQCEKAEKLNKKYPPNPPHETCHIAYIMGIRIENSFGPEVGELNPLFEAGNEAVYIWTHEENQNSAIVVDVNKDVKQVQFWKTLCSVIWLALQYERAFDGGLISDWKLEYRWIYDFSQYNPLEKCVFNNLQQFDDAYMTSGKVIKATDLALLAPEIELMMRDDRAYASLMMLNNSFKQHPICLICELSDHPYHDHLSEEPEMWDHAYVIADMENAIVQACRSVEAILGEPPNAKNQNGVIRHKDRWKELLGINPDDVFVKSGVTYLEFYYDLFFSLRNPSAHSYGNIHYDLAREKTVQAQCFAAIIVREYLRKNVMDLESAKQRLNFNEELLSRVDENISTVLTKEKQPE